MVMPPITTHAHAQNQQHPHPEQQAHSNPYALPPSSSAHAHFPVPPSSTQSPTAPLTPGGFYQPYQPHQPQQLPQNLTLFNPMANSTPIATAGTGVGQGQEGYVRMYDPTAHQQQTALENPN